MAEFSFVETPIESNEALLILSKAHPKCDVMMVAELLPYSISPYGRTERVFCFSNFYDLLETDLALSLRAEPVCGVPTDEVVDHLCRVLAEVVEMVEMGTLERRSIETETYLRLLSTDMYFLTTEQEELFSQPALSGYLAALTYFRFFNLMHEVDTLVCTPSKFMDHLAA